MEIHQALTRSTSIRNILCRHEQGEIFAAEGYAKSSGRVGVCIATSGTAPLRFLTDPPLASVSASQPPPSPPCFSPGRFALAARALRTCCSAWCAGCCGAKRCVCLRSSRPLATPAHRGFHRVSRRDFHRVCVGFCTGVSADPPWATAVQCPGYTLRGRYPHCLAAACGLCLLVSIGFGGFLPGWWASSGLVGFPHLAQGRAPPTW